MSLQTAKTRAMDIKEIKELIRTTLWVRCSKCKNVVKFMDDFKDRVASLIYNTGWRKYGQYMVCAKCEKGEKHVS